MSQRKKHGLLDNEQGDRSLARVGVVGAIAFTFAVITVDVLGERDVEATVYALLTTLDIALIGWAAGPRIARYLLPQLGAAARAVGTAAGRAAKTDNRFKDDER